MKKQSLEEQFYEQNKRLEPTNFFVNCKHLSPWPEELTSEKQPKKQVVTCFLQKEDKVLVLQRGKKDAQYELWGIPGGKLDKAELPLQGLCREIQEETGAILHKSSFTHLASAISKTSSDGLYGLHLYHAEFPNDEQLPIINNNEHLAYKWVTLEQFAQLNLLHAQREAFLFVCDLLSKQLNKYFKDYENRKKQN